MEIPHLIRSAFVLPTIRDYVVTSSPLPLPVSINAAGKGIQQGGIG